MINGDNIKTQSGDYNLLFEKINNLPRINNKIPKRRIIVATIVAETGLTIDTLKYVIDCGWNRSIEIYQPWGIGGLITRPAPQSKIEQRKGRVGRMFPGEFYPLYSENTYKSLEHWQLPDIISIGIKDNFLTIVREQQKQKVLTNILPNFLIKDISLLDLPSVEGFIMANVIANQLGFLSYNTILPNQWPPITNSYILNVNYGCGLTQLGNIASLFSQLTMESIRILLMGYVYNIAGEDLLTIITILGQSKIDFFTRDESKLKNNMGNKVLKSYLENLKQDNQDEDDQDQDDEIIKMMLIFNHFLDKLSSLSIEELYIWCDQMGLHFDNCINNAIRRDDIIEEMYIAGLNPFRLSKNKLILKLIKKEQKKNYIINIKKCIYDAYQNNLLKYIVTNDAYYTNQNIKVKVSNMSKYKPNIILTDLIRLVAVQSPNIEIPAPLLYTIEANIIIKL